MYRYKGRFGVIDWTAWNALIGKERPTIEYAEVEAYPLYAHPAPVAAPAPDVDAIMVLADAYGVQTALDYSSHKSAIKFAALRAAVEQIVWERDEARKGAEAFAKILRGKQSTAGATYQHLVERAERVERERDAAPAPDCEDESKWATHYARQAKRLYDALQALAEAYSNPHSPQHRAAALVEAQTVLKEETL